MTLEFVTITDQEPGTIAALLRRSYRELLEADPLWKAEAAEWDEYDGQVFAHPDTVGACLFVTRVDGQIAGFGSWDPRGRPAYAVIGHNCILPDFRGRGWGRQQIQEILRRLHRLGVKMARVSTIGHTFFVPARRMCVACGFREVRRVVWDRDPRYHLIEYAKDIG